MKNTNDFSKCKTGDKLWSVQLGECEIKDINNNYKYPIKCVKGSSICLYNFQGLMIISDHMQSLFWSKPEIIAPEKPKERISFDLQKALENPDSLVTRDGRKVVEWKWFETCQSLYAVIEDNDMPNGYDNGIIGKYLKGNRISDKDLFIEL